MTIGIIVGVIVVAGVALRLAVPSLSADTVAGGIIDNAGQSVLADCPGTPNCQGSESTDTAHKLDRFSVSGDPVQAIASLAQIITAQKGAAIASQTDRYLHATFTSSIMGYIDDTEFLLSDDNQSVQVRSASRLGRSDLGANAKRIEALRSLTTGKL